MSTGSINDDSRPSSGPPVNTAPTAHHPAQGTSMRAKDGAVGTSPYAGSSSNRGMTIDDPMRLQEQQRPVGPCGSSRGDPESQVEQNRPTASQSNKAHAASSGSRSDPEWKQRVRHKQQRLLLLHHAAKCPHEIDACPVTQHCGDMKRLWKHIEACKDNSCLVPHCYSSRAVVSHYRKCKDPSCPACRPVRNFVRKAKASGAEKKGTSHDAPDDCGELCARLEKMA